MASIPGSGRSPKERNGNPLQYSSSNHMNRKATDWTGCSPWGHESGTQLSDSTTTNSPLRTHCIPRLHPTHSHSSSPPGRVVTIASLFSLWVLTTVLPWGLCYSLWSGGGDITTRPPEGHSPASPVLCLVAQLCLTLYNLKDCSSLGSSVHGILQARILVSRQEYWSGLPCPPPGDLPNPGIEPRSPTWQVDSLPSESLGKPKNTGVGSLSLLQGSFPTQESTSVSCIAGRFFISWASREAPRFYIYVLIYDICFSISDFTLKFIHLIRTDSNAFLFMAK